jgi:hypothetical protein
MPAAPNVAIRDLGADAATRRAPANKLRANISILFVFATAGSAPRKAGPAPTHLSRLGP